MLLRLLSNRDGEWESDRHFIDHTVASSVLDRMPPTTPPPSSSLNLLLPYGFACTIGPSVTAATNLFVVVRPAHTRTELTL